MIKNYLKGKWKLISLFIIWQTQSLCSHWFFLGQDFAVRTVSMVTVQSVYFCFGAKQANSIFATKAAKTKVWKLSFFTLKLTAEAKKIEFFSEISKMDEEDEHFLSASHQKCILILTNRACSGRTGEYCARSVRKRLRANIPQYGPRARLVRG